MEYSYKDTYKLMRNFYKLGIDEVRIIDYLIQTDVAEVTYSQLAENLGLKKSFMPNIRKALKRLENLGIVCIVYKYYEDEMEERRHNPMKACFLKDGWFDTLLNRKL